MRPLEIRCHLQVKETEKKRKPHQRMENPPPLWMAPLLSRKTYRRRKPRLCIDPLQKLSHQGASTHSKRFCCQGNSTGRSATTAHCHCLFRRRQPLLPGGKGQSLQKEARAIKASRDLRYNAVDTVGNRSTRSCATPWLNTKSGTRVACVTWQYHNKGYSWSDAEGKAERKLERRRQRCYAQARQEVKKLADRKKRKRKCAVVVRVRTRGHQKEIVTIVGIQTVRTARDVSRRSPGRTKTRSF